MNFTKTNPKSVLNDCVRFLILLFIASFLIPNVSYAVPILTQANSAPAVGESMIVYYADTSAQPGPAGPNTTWIFNNLSFSTHIESSCVDPLTTPNANYFLGSNISLTSMGAYQYLNSSSSSLVQLGGSGSGQVQIFNPGIDYLTYPFTYNSVATTTNFTGTHVQGTLVGSNVTTGDAYGTLIINGHTYSDVLRIHVVQDLDIDYSGIGHLYSHSVTYSWYDGINKSPIIQIITSQYTGINFSYNKVVSVADFVTSSQEIVSAVSFLNIFPNPTHENSNISFSLLKSSDVLIKIYNHLGEQIFMKDLGHFSPDFSEAIDLSAYAKGIYMIDIIADGRRNTKKLVVN